MGRPRRHARLLEGPVPILVLLVVAAVAGGVAGASHTGFQDLLTYQYGGRRVLEGLSLLDSRDPLTGLRFTYPPFAGVALAPLALLPEWLAAALWTAASVGALAASIVVVRRALGRATPGWLLALLTGGATALEPVWQTLAFGQVNLFLMLAVLCDLLVPARRWSGVLVGIAAGVKLTPVVFVVLLVLVGRRAAAGRALLALGGTVLVGLLVTPASAAYWAHGLVDASRVGPPELAHNQSVYGALTRLLGGTPPPLLWLAVAGPLSLAVLLVGVRWWRRGDQVFGACLAALAMLVASPISWTHHWVWAVPTALALWEHRRWVSVAWSSVFVARPVVWPPYGHQREFGWSAWDHVVGNAYLLAALALAFWGALSEPDQGQRAGLHHRAQGEGHLVAPDVGHPAEPGLDDHTSRR
jgi:alpha-1,2-mannosyltransferase